MTVPDKMFGDGTTEINLNISILLPLQNKGGKIAVVGSYAD